MDGEVVPSSDVLALIRSNYPLVPLTASAFGETAQRWGYADSFGNWDRSLGEIGLISSVTQAFCSTCTRARLSTEGKLYLCLFASLGFDLRELIRNDCASDRQIASSIAHIWENRVDRYSQLRTNMSGDESKTAKRVEMSYIGG
jgi:cyclic pyranopterin phosphate synthase